MPESYPHWATERPWRVGRKVGRTVYARVSGEPSDSDVLIGVMDHADLALDAVAAHNKALGIDGVDPAGTMEP
jgi:hypothetical protein